jgi:AhpD family alkylhydroperoxidase
MTKALHLIGLATGTVAGLLSALPAFAEDAVAAAKADMAATLGQNSVQLNLLPDAYYVEGWALGRKRWVDQAGVIPPKYRVLIGLAVSSQIPCAYCIYADTSDAKLFGATDQEIKEAIMTAADTRFWSTLLNGNQIDFEAFKAEIDAAAAAARASMATAQ